MTTIDDELKEKEADLAPANFSERELAAVLTGLRMLQDFLPELRMLQDLLPEAQLQGDRWDILTNCGNLDPITVEEIDALCERLNT